MCCEGTVMIAETNLFHESRLTARPILTSSDHLSYMLFRPNLTTKDQYYRRQHRKLCHNCKCKSKQVKVVP